MTFRPHVPTPKPLATVKIAAPGSASGFTIINERDFDASQYKRYVESPAATTGKPPRDAKDAKEAKGPAPRDATSAD